MTRLRLILICMNQALSFWVVSTSIPSPCYLQSGRQESSQSLVDTHSLDNVVAPDAQGLGPASAPGLCTSKRSRNQENERLEAGVGFPNPLKTYKKCKLGSAEVGQGYGKAQAQNPSAALSIDSHSRPSGTISKPYTRHSPGPRKHHSLELDQGETREELLTRPLTQHNSTPMVPVTLQSLEPSRTALNVQNKPPYYAIDQDRVRTYLSSYAEKLDDPFFRHVKYPYEKEYFEGVSLCHSLMPGGQHIFRVYTERNEIATPANALYSLELLLKWVLYNNEVFVNRVGNRTEIKRNGLNKLLERLFMEFSGPEDGLAIMGSVTEERLNTALSRAQDVFSSMQKLLIHQIAACKPASCAFKNALTIIGIWYKSTEPDLWRNYFFDDQVFWSSMTRAIKASLQVTVAKWRRVSLYEQEVPASICGWLGNFFVPNPMALPYKSREAALILYQVPPLFSFQSQVLSEKERSVLGRVKEFFDLTIAWHDTTKDFEMMPVTGIKSAMHPKLMGVGNFALRLIDESKRMLPFQKVSRKLENLLKRLRYSYTILHESFTEQEKSLLKMDDHSRFLEWLVTRLFCSQERNGIFGNWYSLFGIFTEEVQPRNKNAFGPVTKLLISYITTRHRKTELAHNLVAYSLLGYWLKNNCKCLWEVKFQSDADFWQVVVKSLVAKRD